MNWLDMMVRIFLFVLTVGFAICIALVVVDLIFGLRLLFRNVQEIRDHLCDKKEDEK